VAGWLVVGLGNPGVAYATHRHNVGRLTVERLAGQAGVGWKSRRLLRADVAEIACADDRVIVAGGGAPTTSQRLVLATTKTYMNDSGNAVAALLGWAKLKADHLVVVHDEIDLDPGRLRLKYGGGDNGHNGLRSIRARLGTGDFFRVRLGVGRPSGAMPVEKWVLSAFAKSDRAEVDEQIDRAAAATVTLVTRGLEAAQQAFNS